MTHNPFAGKNLRCMYDENAECWLFAAVDICAILMDSDYETARKFWKRFKLERIAKVTQVVRKSYHLKFPAKNGKYYFTEVLTTKEVIYLMQIIPSRNADPFRYWLADMVVSHTAVEPMLVEAGQVCAAEIREKYMTDLDKFNNRIEVERKVLV